MPEQDAFSVDEFCKRNRISRATFYNLQKVGQAPRVMKVGSRTLISVEAAEQWRRELERVAARGTNAQ
jgi:predicted DNA-binding transcriptional regulator AlpA